MKRSMLEIILAVTFICLTWSPVSGLTSDTFRCPNGSLVRINDKLPTVMRNCGPPTYSSRLPAGYYGTLEIEEWVYNLGPTSFMMYLTFTRGVLTGIESGEYGY
jgi:hypothetical protein